MGDKNILLSVSERLPSYQFSLLPTPLHQLNRLGSRDGIRIWCKRDDMTGFGFGGNKSRKLNYLIKNAVDGGYDSIITFGSVQSNWCRMAAAAAAVRGLDTYLILSGSKPGEPTGNLLLDNLLGASVEFTEIESDEEVIGLCQEKIERLRSEGKNPYYMAVGGSNNIGNTGYIKAMGEIIDFEISSGINFSKIFIATGSGGTQTGLVAGKLISGFKGDIIGVSVSRSEDAQKERVIPLVTSLLQFHGFDFDKREISEAVIIEDNFMGGGYRVNTAECEEAVKLFARCEGIFLDYVYTGKAAAALIDYSARGVFSADENILFIHSGGSVQLFE